MRLIPEKIHERKKLETLNAALLEMDDILDPEKIDIVELVESVQMKLAELCRRKRKRKNIND
jgi:hypothetical protein